MNNDTCSSLSYRENGSSKLCRSFGVHVPHYPVSRARGPVSYKWPALSYRSHCIIAHRVKEISRMCLFPHIVTVLNIPPLIQHLPTESHLMCRTYDRLLAVPLRPFPLAIASTLSNILPQFKILRNSTFASGTSLCGVVVRVSDS